MVLVQKWPFLQLFFLGNISQEKVFYDILKRKKAFLGHKNKKIKNPKNWHFSKRVNHGFRPKKAIIQTFFFFNNIGHENVFYDILERKYAFQGYKNKKIKKSKNWHFFKGVNKRFWSKRAIFPTFVFIQYRPGKCLLQYSRMKKRHSRL